MIVQSRSHAIQVLTHALKQNEHLNVFHNLKLMMHDHLRMNFQPVSDSGFDFGGRKHEHEFAQVSGD